MRKLLWRDVMIKKIRTGCSRQKPFTPRCASSKVARTWEILLVFTWQGGLLNICMRWEREACECCESYLAQWNGKITIGWRMQLCTSPSTIVESKSCMQCLDFSIFGETFSFSTLSCATSATYERGHKSDGGGAPNNNENDFYAPIDIEWLITIMFHSWRKCEQLDFLPAFLFAQ